MKKKKALVITIDDIYRTAWLEGLYKWDCTSIEKITEKILPDKDCYAFGCFLEDENIESDWVNTEYMGYLTFHCRRLLSDEDLVNGINNALKVYFRSF